MCDYSLHGIRNRLAEEGETLFIHRFSTGSNGLTSSTYAKPIERPPRKGLAAIWGRMFNPEIDECAVCIPDGTRVVIHGLSPGTRHVYKLGSIEPATFRQVSPYADTHRDALEFQNGAIVPLQELDEGQSVEVLSVSSNQAIRQWLEFESVKWESRAFL